MSNLFNKREQSESRDAIKMALSECAKDSGGRPIIYTVLRSVSRSGMMRRITAYVLVNNKPVSLSWHYDRAHGRMADDSCGGWANKVPGFGMDMGFHLASNIASLAGLDSCDGFRQEWI